RQRARHVVIPTGHLQSRWRNADRFAVNLNDETGDREITGSRGADVRIEAGKRDETVTCELKNLTLSARTEGELFRSTELRRPLDRFLESIEGDTIEGFLAGSYGRWIERG